MSLFRRPKKAIVQRRVFSVGYDEEHNENSENDGANNGSKSTSVDESDKMDVDDRVQTPPPPSISQLKERKNDKKSKDSSSERKGIAKKTSLLSFGDEDEEGEVFQVKKSSHSKKVMKMLDKERRKKKHRERDAAGTTSMASTTGSSGTSNNNGINSRDQSQHQQQSDRRPSSQNPYDVVQATSYASSVAYTDDGDDLASSKRQKSQNSNSSIHTEIRTDDFVLVVKQTEPTQPNVVLNGRAALCAGRDDMSSEDDEHSDSGTDTQLHRFNKPDHFKTLLESGAIPDAAMIHEARKKRQKARELGDFVSLEEKKPIDNKKGRLIREDADDDCSDDEERVDMSAITGAKEREERREKFYSVQHGDSDEDSDRDMHEWENQQIRKGVTGAQLVNAQQESLIYSQYLIKSGSNESSPARLSTGNLLEQAYARSALDKSHQLLKSKQKSEKKPAGPRMPHEIFNCMHDRLAQVKELNAKHVADIERITKDLKIIDLEELECEQNAPIVASKFRFYQELRGYVQDLVECFDEKLPKIMDLERKAMAVLSKQSNVLTERRRQDVRDQAKEVTQKPNATGTVMNNAARKEEDERIRRAAEREGRRTRRRRDRERIEIKNSHLDGMSSDDEIADHDATLYKNQLKQLNAEATLIFEDVTEEFSELGSILQRFEVWRNRDLSSYKDTYFSLCLPKIIGPMLRLYLITWNPLEENSPDLERMQWFDAVMRYGFIANQSETDLIDDPDIRLIPTLVEKIILPKVTELVEKSWDPLSSSQSLRLVNLMRRLIRDYPSLKPTSKYMRTLFLAILDKMKLSLDNDVFIPIFPKQLQEAKSSFFQRQFSSALKLLRNFLSWQGILSDTALKEIAILSLLNRYLLSAIRVCAPIDAVAKSHIIVNTLPRVWLQQEAILESLELFLLFLRTLLTQLDRKNPLHNDSMEKMTQILNSLHMSLSVGTQ